ncbi:MAG: hypothetical protein LLG04_11825 [Parachlamydia sp.]|nr:hypothetical protein [Parachlamydia sp.]
MSFRITGNQEVTLPSSPDNSEESNSSSVFTSAETIGQISASHLPFPRIDDLGSSSADLSVQDVPAANMRSEQPLPEIKEIYNWLRASNKPGHTICMLLQQYIKNPSLEIQPQWIFGWLTRHQKDITDLVDLNVLFYYLGIAAEKQLLPAPADFFERQSLSLLVIKLCRSSDELVPELEPLDGICKIVNHTPFSPICLLTDEALFEFFRVLFVGIESLECKRFTNILLTMSIMAKQGKISDFEVRIKGLISKFLKYVKEEDEVGENIAEMIKDLSGFASRSKVSVSNELKIIEELLAEHCSHGKANDTSLNKIMTGLMDIVETHNWKTVQPLEKPLAEILGNAVNRVYISSSLQEGTDAYRLIHLFLSKNETSQLGWHVAKEMLRHMKNNREEMESKEDLDLRLVEAFQLAGIYIDYPFPHAKNVPEIREMFKTLADILAPVHDCQDLNALISLLFAESTRFNMDCDLISTLIYGAGLLASHKQFTQHNMGEIFETLNKQFCISHNNLDSADRRLAAICDGFGKLAESELCQSNSSILDGLLVLMQDLSFENLLQAEAGKILLGIAKLAKYNRQPFDTIQRHAELCEVIKVWLDRQLEHPKSCRNCDEFFYALTLLLQSGLLTRADLLPHQSNLQFVLQHMFDDANLPLVQAIHLRAFLDAFPEANLKQGRRVSSTVQGYQSRLKNYLLRREIGSPARSFPKY